VRLFDAKAPLKPHIFPLPAELQVEVDRHPRLGIIAAPTADRALKLAQLCLPILSRRNHD
jgi:hypothetical protein